MKLADGMLSMPKQRAPEELAEAKGEGWELWGR